MGSHEPPVQAAVYRSSAHSTGDDTHTWASVNDAPSAVVSAELFVAV
jgi:hypothetical protein